MPLKYERAILNDSGIVNELNKDAFDKGLIVLNLQAEIGGENIRIIAKFSDFQPYTRFKLEALDLDQTRHQGHYRYLLFTKLITKSNLSLIINKALLDRLSK